MVTLGNRSFDKKWMRRRWFDFRMGHSLYLIFAMTFANFIVIQYRLLIERLPSFQDILINLWIFAIIFAVIYVPTAIGIGHWHNKNQLRIEATIMAEQNPYVQMMLRELKGISKEVKELNRKLEVLEKAESER